MLRSNLACELHSVDSSLYSLDQKLGWYLQTEDYEWWTDLLEFPVAESRTIY